MLSSKGERGKWEGRRGKGREKGREGKEGRKERENCRERERKEKLSPLQMFLSGLVPVNA